MRVYESEFLVLYDSEFFDGDEEYYLLTRTGAKRAVHFMVNIDLIFMQ